MLRIAVYGIIAGGLTSALYIATDAVAHRMNPWAARCGPFLIGIAITLPIIMVDAARTTNRLLGPFARVHGAVRRLANRDHVSPRTDARHARTLVVAR